MNPPNKNQGNLPGISAPVAPKDAHGFILPEGNVKIISGSYVWHLQSSRLEASPKFKELLRAPAHTPVYLTRKDKAEGKTIMWTFLMEMRANSENNSEECFQKFKWIDVSKDRAQFPNIANIPQTHRARRAYDIFFRVLSNQPYSFGPTNDPQSGIACAISVILIAEDLGAIEVVTNFIEVYLLRMGKDLWNRIEEEPSKWAMIGQRLKSPLIFRDAMVHLIGQVDSRRPINRNLFQVSEKSRKIDVIIKKKIKELSEQKKDIEQQLVEFYPARMYHPQEGNYIPDRSVYSADIYLWQARSLVMQYVSQAILNKFHHSALDGGIKFYRTIAEGGDAYLTLEDLGNFFARFAMSSKATPPFEMALNTIKNGLKEIAVPLMKDNSQGGANPMAEKGYLTCVEITDDELPWLIDN